MIKTTPGEDLQTDSGRKNAGQKDQPQKNPGENNPEQNDPDAHGEHAREDSLFAEDQTLSPEFVRHAGEAIERRDREEFEYLIHDLHPADIADLLGLLKEEDRPGLVHMLETELLPDVLAELDDDLRESVVEAMGPAKVAEAVAELDTDDAAFVLEDLAQDKRDEILAEVPPEERTALRAALEFAEETAGRVMQREFFAAPAYWTVGQIIDRLRGSEELPEKFYEVFVVDPSFKPIGGVPLSTLLKARRETVIKDLMTSRDLRIVPAGMDQEEVAYLFEQYNLISCPVVDESERLIGMITVDDVVEMVREETQEDMLALGGVEADTGLSDTVAKTVRSRFSWLAVNLATAIFASLVIALFDGAIEKIVALAVLMPIVASMGGNAGTQTLTVAVRSLATKDLTAANAARIIYREALVGFLNGIIFALIMGFLAAAWYFGVGWGDRQEAIQLGLVVGAAMVINLLAAGLAGILVPIGLQRAGADPAVSSAVFVTTVTDVLGFFVFLGLAAVILLPGA